MNLPQLLAVLTTTFGLLLTSQPRLHADTAPASPLGVTLDNPGSEPRVRLVYHFQPGEFTRFEVMNRSSIVTQFAEVTEKVTYESQTWKQYRVISVDENGNGLLEPMIERLVMTASFGDSAPLRIDSKSPEDGAPQLREVVRNVGRPVTRVLVSPAGELRKVTLLEENGQPSSGTATSSANVNFLTALPSADVGLGARWRDRFAYPVRVGQGLSQTVTLQRSYELVALKGTVAEILLKTAVITPVNNPEVEMQLMQTGLSGTIEFDTAKGCVVSQKTTVTKAIVGAPVPQGKIQSTLEVTERWLPPASGVEPARLQVNP